MLTPGVRADIAAWDQRGVDRVGVHDPLAGLLLSGPSSRAALVLVGGRVLVEDGRPTHLDPGQVAVTANALLSAGRDG